MNATCFDWTQQQLLKWLEKAARIPAAASAKLAELMGGGAALCALGDSMFDMKATGAAGSAVVNEMRQLLGLTDNALTMALTQLHSALAKFDAANAAAVLASE